MYGCLVVFFLWAVNASILTMAIRMRSFHDNIVLWRIIMCCFIRFGRNFNSPFVTVEKCRSTPRVWLKNKNTRFQSPYNLPNHYVHHVVQFSTWS